VKPETCSDILTKTAMNINKNLTKNYILILWSGAYDIAKNDTMKAFRCLVDFAKNSSHINTFTAKDNHSQFKYPGLKLPETTIVDLFFQSRALRPFTLNLLCDLSF
jgi:hypothetical protein